MTHCTRTLAIAFVLLVASWPATTAWADGDPASDVLALQALYVPQDAGVPASQHAQLETLLAAARRGGYQLRVALIAAPADLGSVPELWRQPQTYARFLGQELSLLYRGRLLVVMPGGYGLYRLAGVRSAERSAITRLPGTGAALGTSALTAIQRLLTAAGASVALPRSVMSRGSSRTDAVSWIVFAIGAVLIMLAWGASLRARPLRARGAG